MKKRILSTVLVVILMVSILFTLTACGDKKEEKKDKAQIVVENYFENIGKNQFAKAFEYIDWNAYFMVENSYEYSKIEEDYDEYVEENKEYIESLNNTLETFSDYYEDAIKDFETYEVKLNKVNKSEKVEDTKNIYSVEAEVELTIQETEDDEKETNKETYEIYVIKLEDEYKIIGGIDDFMNSIY